MNRKIALLMPITLAMLLLFLGRAATTGAAPAQSNVCGPITPGTIWTPAGNPYAVCSGGATLASGASLTIQPGVVVSFASGSLLTVAGNLSALGTTAQPITFTGAVATPGSWQGLVIQSLSVTPANATLDHMVFQYGGTNTATGAQIYTQNATVRLTHSRFGDGAGVGLYFDTPSNVFVQDIAALNNGSFAYVWKLDPTSLIDAGGLSASGNGRDSIYIPGTVYLHGQHTLPSAGIPYLINSVLGNQEGDSLTIEPGAELRFTPTGWMNIRGDLQAIGLPDRPITLTGDLPNPGYWIGLVLYGLTQPATAQLDYVTVAYGGQDFNGANILVDFGNLLAAHTVVRNSQRDGVRFNSGGRGSIIYSQIYSNTQYGVRNLVTPRWVLAANNWWGSPSGPTPDTPACGAGTGDHVTDGVLFQPVLGHPFYANFGLADAPSLTLTPRRWFAPADNTSKVYFDITLRDGNGNPLPGRVVNVSSSLGAVTEGGVTDTSGHTLAYIVSGSAGDADVTAALSNAGCEGALSPTSRVTFTPPVSGLDLFPESPASYFDGNISVSPLPVTAGQFTLVQAKLTNPLSVPITVDVAFGYAQAGIGLVFGPIGEQDGLVIGPHATVQGEFLWSPIVSGHYCIQVTYTIVGVGAQAGLDLPAAGSTGFKQLNLDVQPGNMASPVDQFYLQKADQAWQVVNKLPARGTNLQFGLVDRWWGWAKKSAEDIATRLGSDPPRQDYSTFTIPITHSWPATQSNVDISPARAAALNAASAKLADAVAFGQAAALARDRYAGAAEAHDLLWEAQQANASLLYQQQMGTALLAYADDLDAYQQVLVAENVTNNIITVGAVISYQQSLQTSGFTQQEMADAHLVGFTDAEIAAFRQEIIAADPNNLAGDLLLMYPDEAAASRELGVFLQASYTYAPFLAGGATSLSLPSSTPVSNTLAQIRNTSADLQIRNPLTYTALIDLKARRIDLAADWLVSVFPSQVNLTPGAQTTVTVTILTGSLVPQGAQPRIAVEGYAGSQLLGGVVVEVAVPAYTEVLTAFKLYLPRVSR